MPIKRIVLYLVFITFLCSCQEHFCPVEDYNIIPFPNSAFRGSPKDFVLTNNVSLEYDSEFEVSANFLKNYIENGSNFTLKGKC